MADTTPVSNEIERYKPVEITEITPSRVLERIDYLKKVGSPWATQLDTASFNFRLTKKQRMYAAKLLEVGPDEWQQAARFAGYAPGTAKTQIESSPALVDYCAALCWEQSVYEAITVENVAGRLDRLANKAEAAGEYGAAIRAVKLIGDMKNAFTRDEDDGPGSTNSTGAPISIAGPTVRTETDDAAYGAKYQAIMEQNENGWKRATLPQASSLPLEGEPVYDIIPDAPVPERAF